MHSFIITGGSQNAREEEVRKLLTRYEVDSIDICRITVETAIGIALIRQIIQKVMRKPVRSPMKAVIIDGAQNATVQAQNALLKTLEEPPKNTILLLLVIGNLDSLLPTVLSRCQIITLKDVSPALTDKEQEALQAMFLSLTHITTATCFEMAEKIAKDKEATLDWLKKMIYIGRKITLEETTKGDGPNTKRFLVVLNLLQKAHRLAETTNLNPRFTLEKLFLSLV